MFLRFIAFSSPLTVHKWWWISSALDYFLLLKNEQHFTPACWRAEFLSNLSLQNLNMYTTRWIHSKFFVWISVTILSTFAKFCCVSVTKMWEKNRHHYFWNALLWDNPCCWFCHIPTFIQIPNFHFAILFSAQFVLLGVPRCKANNNFSQLAQFSKNYVSVWSLFSRENRNFWFQILKTLFLSRYVFLGDLGIVHHKPIV